MDTRTDVPLQGTPQQQSADTARRFARALRTRPQAAPDLRDIREGQGTHAVLRRDSRLRRMLAGGDLLAAVIALGAATAASGRAPGVAMPFAALATVLFCKLARLYDRDEHVIRKSTLDQAPQLMAVATLYALLADFSGGLLVQGGFGKAAIAVLWLTLLVSLIVLRYAARRLAARVTTPERVLVLGGAEDAARLQSRIETAHSLRAELVGRVALERTDRNRPEPIGSLDDLDFLMRAHAVERVIIAPSDSRSDAKMLDTIRLVKALGVKVSVLPRLFEVVGSSMEFDDVDGITVLGLRRYGLPKTSWYLKRTFDVTLTAAGLLFLSPALAVIALAIKLTSPGPVLFRQPRVGRGGESFEMLKFRTMNDGADELKETLREHNEARHNGFFKIADDPRVTPIGRWLRATSLDELPQLINVLRGEMSLVGPRPLVEEEDRKIAGWHHRRREGTPGMTGVWQMLGPTRVPLDEMVKLDYLYRANWSLWLDMKILLRTAAHVASRRGI